ncbi:hypothetical protein FB45DRAFT_1060944 [Roridomyces roridus]|uniref:DUF6533 domain-containing protein n=1 Tax=Roridomyces roridus TaxID=1738132 RepID=A0AAD7FKB3_9AGAR|nr:hypothetical protein FB45DRAFT_1060944 [Roridomyces roridus]
MNTVTKDVQIQVNVGHYLDAISFTILFYDFFLTLGMEISRYWRLEFSWATILFLCNRYITLLGNIPIVFQSFWTTPGTPQKLEIYTDSVAQTCRVLSVYHQYFIIVLQTLGGVILIMRTYALYGRSKRILIFLLVLTLGVIGGVVGSTIFSGKSSRDEMDVPLLIGCTYELTRRQGLGHAISWAVTAGFDLVVFALTLYRALSQRQQNRSNLLHVLLRDGCIYFGVMVLCNLANILTFVAVTSSHVRGVATTFTNIASSLMISRLMLNMRDPALLRGRYPYTVDTDNESPYRTTDFDAGVFTSYIAPSGTVDLPRVPAPGSRQWQGSEYSSALGSSSY